MWNELYFFHYLFLSFYMSIALFLVSFSKFSFFLIGTDWDKENNGSEKKLNSKSYFLLWNRSLLQNIQWNHYIDKKVWFYCALDFVRTVSVVVSKIANKSRECWNMTSIAILRWKNLWRMQCDEFVYSTWKQIRNDLVIKWKTP